MNKRCSVSLAVMILLLIIPVLSTGCGPEANGTDKPGVVVSILPQSEFVEKIGGDKVSVTVMIPPGASPHSYEPTPSQMAALSNADMYIKVGSGIDFELTWMDKLIAQNQDMLVVDSSQGITIHEMTAGDEHDAGEHAEEEHDHGTLDPHIWMSPKNAEIMVNNIADGLFQIDPDNRSYYEENRDAYLAELERLDAEIREGLSGIENRVFMVYHPAFGYLADEYDLTMLPIEEEGKEPTAAGLRRLIDQAQEHGITAIFVEPQFNPQSAEVIADEIGASVILADPLAREYRENLRSIAEQLIEALQ